MRRGLLAAGTATAAVFASALLPAAANSAVRSGAGSDAVVTSVSCASGGSCAAGGQYLDARFAGHAFVLTGKNGAWHKAIVVPGLAALKPKDSGIDSVSCAPHGACVAGGTFLDASKRSHVFVTSELNGKWRRLVPIFTGTAAQGVRLSCPAAGNCAAGDGRPPFVISEAHGRWGKPIQLPGANNRLDADRVVVSCASAGNCSAGWGPFIVTEQNGHWGKPTAVPGLAKLGTSPAITSVSCTAPANCAAGGSYLRKGGATEVFVASKQAGHWGHAIEIPGFTALNEEGFGLLASVSCVSAGNCVAGGSYAAQADFAGGSFQAYVASEQHGRWGKAIEVPGIPSPGTSICEPDSSACVAAQNLAVSCSSGGTCAAGGWFDTPKINGEAAFVSTYKNGHWAKAIQVPGLAALDTATSSKADSVACTPSGACAAGGSYSAKAPNIGPAFLTFEKNGTWGRAQTVRF